MPRLVVDPEGKLSRVFVRSLGRTHWKGFMRCEILPRAGWQIDLSLCVLCERYKDPSRGQFYPPLPEIVVDKNVVCKKGEASRPPLWIMDYGTTVVVAIAVSSSGSLSSKVAVHPMSPAGASTRYDGKLKVLRPFPIESETIMVSLYTTELF